MKNTFVISLIVLAFAFGCSHEESNNPQPRSTTMSSQDESPDSQPATRPSKPAAKISASGYDVTPLGPEEKALLTKDLTPMEYRVTCQSGTEAPNSGDLLHNKKTGTYTCRVCGLPLFNSHTKFRSGTGWPSFFSPYDPDHVRDVRDATHGMVRVENRCARCDAHLGHVFNDGPQPTGLRYCINSASLDFVGADEELPPKSLPKDR